MVDCKARAAHLDRTASTRDKARLQCLTREGVWYWLTALPCQALSLHLAKQKFVFAAKCCLGDLVFLAAAECPMRRCCAKTGNLGDHPISCGISGERIAKHNHVQDALFQAAQQAGLAPVREQEGLLMGSSDKPNNILFRGLLAGHYTCLNVTATKA